MHAALEAGGVDLFKRASYLNQEQAKEAVAISQNQPTSIEATKLLRHMSDDEINEELEVIDSLESDESIKVDQHNDVKLWEDKTSFQVRA